LNKRFFTFHTKKRPFFILKWAESNDGFIAPITREEQKPVWITSELSRQLVHKWRSEEQAILVGTNTVLEDNPTLTTRNWIGNNPIRIVLDQNNKITKESHIFDNQAKTISISKNEIRFDENFAWNIASFLFEQEIQSVLIEGGTKTLQTFIDSNLWDEARVFKGAISFNKGIKAPEFNFASSNKTQLTEDELVTFRNHDHNHHF
jgi:diaminohydroxyphosphoribosylaminopyrimidine deaminase/5-amino-6-(5-phosphoribosylamino)uracil reductase